jgi:hypothetical protein
MTALLPPARQVFLDLNGQPLAGGAVWHYIPNTDSLRDTYQDPNLTILNSNPVLLDAAGRAAIWGSGQYRQVVFDASGNQIWDAVTSG